jgi:SARP family transcriptional regulator, regulator of embCAB operon
MTVINPAVSAAGTAAKRARRAVSADRVAVSVLGNLTIRSGTETIGADQLGGVKPRQILEILLLQHGRPVSKSTLISRLWGEHASAGAASTLESYISVLRRQLGWNRQGPLRTTTGGYYIDRTMVELDLDSFDRLLREAEYAEPLQAYAALTRALAMSAEPLLGNELLPAWAEEERSFHAGRVAAARVLAAEAAAALGRLPEAITLARQALQAQPINERAWTVLILALEQSGQPADGLQAYEQCRRMLLEELGCCPGPALRQSHARMLQTTAATDDDLAEVFSALLTLHGRSATRPRELRAAGEILHNFLRQALAPAGSAGSLAHAS